LHWAGGSHLGNFKRLDPTHLDTKQNALSACAQKH
jgi:hypothetical protein